MTKSSNAIRRDFLDFFAARGHQIVASSPLVPGNDPTLLFTNAGMVQFKDVFLGAEKRSYSRAVSSQRCVRAGGKHNDLDQVGYTARHHTFFEMLGNFSFGDYFKKEAIAWAWELLTEVWKLPPERLLVTIYHTDDEAFELWHTMVGLPAERIIRIGDNKGAPFASDNFWQMADTGPCGPCSEIFYDHGAHIPGGPPGSPDEDGDRFIEIWNNVFMQFDRQPDGTLLPLPAPCVDTGMGLERLCAVLQHVHSNYEIDLFQHLIKAAATLTGTADLDHKSLRVIADHIRACTFLIVDGVLPSNEGRGYVLRRIIRRAIRHIWKLGALRNDGLFWRMVEPLCAVMGEAYPELPAKRALVEQALRAEEAAFAQTLANGMENLRSRLEGDHVRMNAVARFLGANILSDWRFEGVVQTSLHLPSPHLSFFRQNDRAENEKMRVYVRRDGDLAQVEHAERSHGGGGEWMLVELDKQLSGDPILDGKVYRIDASVPDQREYRVFSGDLAFILYDTYGFPLDLTEDICREANVTVDVDRFDALLQQQRERARAASKFAGSAGLPGELLGALPPTHFCGYDALAADPCTVLALVVDGRSVPRIGAGERAIVVLDKTPFYAESGGQVGDTGVLTGSAGQRFAVSDTHKFANQFHGHIGSLESGALAVGDSVAAAVDGERRQAIVINHSATHLLHAALREVLGEHVSQKGSLVAPDRLRFDFSHFQAVSHEQLAQIEMLVNAQIRGNAEAEVQQMDMQQALDFGAMALFGEKYGERVRVLRMGAFSTELCGGTHVRHTGDIGLFKILSEGGVAAGVRRIEAVTGAAALAHVASEEQRLAQIATLLGGGQAEVLDKLQQLLQRQRQLEREIEQIKAKSTAGAAAELAANAREIGGVRVVAARLEGIDGKALRDAVDQLKDRLGNAVIVLAGASDGRASLVAGVSGTALGRIKAGELVAHIASQIGGKGGGRPDMAQGGGDDGAMLQSALAGVEVWLAQRL
ncbi:MAG: alanine--tRNA ligase [Xanthomonadaceae bacterium]|nr:alanine--tRNA ligase [Xanthomonadaceae bacterium]MDP2184641.1 alanine--tRNA ligase [Xanthomonadales bacterium]MDZ4117199.1 alanine--tRNA ligase [Xanthomonadaceae bacterium]MDZ4377125.1 alanine--tRNA ligase [Xanthomonadaceae bacterium]